MANTRHHNSNAENNAENNNAKINNAANPSPPPLPTLEQGITMPAQML
jgi:subtilase family serine protease